MTTNDLHQHLRQLVAETCGYDRDSLERKQGLTKIVCLMQQSGRIWRAGSSASLHDYEDALQKNWLHFCDHVCELYNPDISSPLTWFNNTLKWRIKDIQKHDINRFPPQIDLQTGEVIDPIDTIPAPTEAKHSMTEEIKQWLEDNKKRLQRIHLRDRSEINTYVVINRHVLGETNWKTLGQEFSVPIATLANFYQRRCLPLLQEWGESQEYLVMGYKEPCGVRDLLPLGSMEK